MSILLDKIQNQIKGVKFDIRPYPNILCLFISVLFSLIGFIVFGAKHEKGSLSYSFAFTVIGQLLCLAACIVSVLHWRKTKS